MKDQELSLYWRILFACPAWAVFLGVVVGGLIALHFIQEVALKIKF